MNRKVGFSRIVLRLLIILVMVTGLFSWSNQKTQVVQASTPITLKWPWKQGESWTFNQGPHGRGSNPVCNNTPRSALDFGPSGSTEVIAAASGRIKRATTNKDTGNKYLIIEHTSTFFTYYGHLASFAVSEGQQVVQGQLIGIVGNTGASYVHLHFEFLANADSGEGTPKSIDGETVSGYLITYLGCDNDTVEKWSEGSISQGSWYRDTVTSAPGIPSDNTKTGSSSCSISIGDGTSRTQQFVDTYSRNGGATTLGCATEKAHWVDNQPGNIAVVQSFTGVGGYGANAIIHDELKDQPAGSIPAYVVHGGIYQRYLSLGGPKSFLGPPTSDEFVNLNGSAQSSFKNGYITWSGSDWKGYTWGSTQSNQWRLEYHNGRNLGAGPTYVRNVNIPTSNTKLNLPFGSNAPEGGKLGVWKDNFSIRSTAAVTFNPGKYTFRAKADDGFVMSVCGTKIIDQWHDSGGTDYYTNTYTFTTTSRSCIVAFDYYENTGGALVLIEWWK